MRAKMLLPSILTLVFAFSCTTKNPFTGKNNLNFVSNEELFPSSFQQYDQFLTEHKVVRGTTAAKNIENVGTKIKNASERYLKSLGYNDYLDGYKWEYKLVEDKAVNAFCMPGGKIVVYTGILPITKDEIGRAHV